MEQDWKLAALGWLPPLVDGKFNSELFNKIIKNQNALYPLLGPEGQAFEALAKNIYVEEIYDENLSEALARYESPDPENKIPARIKYGQKVFANRAAFFQARTHEMVHAIDEALNPALHAVPGNMVSDLILAPHDFCLLYELMERTAASIDKLLQVKYVQALYPDNALSPGEQAIADAPQTYLPQYAAVTLEGTPVKGPHGNALIYYYDFALSMYEQTLRTRLETKNHPGITIVKLGDDDISRIGKKLGVSLFETAEGKPAYSVEGMKFTIEQQKRLAFLNHFLRSSNRNNLYTLSQELADRRSSPEKFLQESLSYKTATIQNRPDGGQPILLR